MRTASAVTADSSEVIDTFKSTLGEKSVVYFGRYYKPYTSPKPKGNAFFNSSEWQMAKLIYDGNKYTMRLRYEIVSDVILIPGYYTEKLSIELNSEKISEFTLNNHLFINLKKDIPTEMSSGFYEVLYADNVQSFLCRRRKDAKQIIEAMKVDYEFNEHIEYYYKNNEGYKKISSLGSVLALFPDKKKEIKQYLNKNNISFKENREYALQTIGALCNKLNQK